MIFLPNLRFRAQGEYAYCQVVREMQRSKTDFRVVALSATPGTDINAVRLMLQNLLISNIELRSEDSPDIVPYTFQRTIEKIVVPMGKELEDVRQKFLTILEVRSICTGHTTLDTVTDHISNSKKSVTVSKFGGTEEPRSAPLVPSICSPIFAKRSWRFWAQESENV